MRKLICLGDSLTFGLRVPHSQAWPRLVARETGMEVLNLGISGDTTGGMLARLQTLTGGGPVAPDAMPVLVIMGGSNDIFYAGTDAVAKANIGAMIHQAMAAHMLPLVGIPLPGTGAWTGALVATLLDIRMRHAIPAILLGLIIAGAITTAVTMGVVILL